MTEDDLSIRNDPDYKDFYQNNKNDPNSARAADSKHLAVFKIKEIVQKQFALELEFKEEEIHKIEQRINHIKGMLDRLRAYVAAGYFGSGGLIVPGFKAVDNEPKAKKQKIAANEVDQSTDPAIVASMLKTCDNFNNKSDEQSPSTESSPSCQQAMLFDQPKLDSESRFYVSKKLIVGNVSKYLLADARKENDQSTHKWMVYVRTDSGNDKEIEKYVKCVLFFLHPSYIPNDIVTVTKPPFQVTRRGWGEFPVRVQLHFRDSRNKRFDVIHNLKLDKTYTGLQTLGAETIVNIELQKHTNNENEIISKSLHSRPASPQTIAETTPSQSPDPESKGEVSKEDAEIIKLSLPVLADLRSKIPTVECASSCVSSANPSRCNSPVADIPFNNAIPFDSDMDNCLHQLLPNAPLIATSGLRSKFFTCPSLEHYQNWHFTKRRAHEWYRASFLRRLYLRDYKETHSRIPSTKEILIWLRHCGFTPAEKDFNVVFCSVQCCSKCGKCLDKDINQNIFCSNCSEQNNNLESLPESISLYSSVLSNVKIKEETLQCIEKAETSQENDETDMDLDITNVEKDHGQTASSPYKMNTIIPTLAENWVSDIANNIGIVLGTHVMGSTRTPVVQAMLLKSMKMFMSQLLRKSNMEAKVSNKNTLEPALVTFRQVHSAILKEPIFDFLTDAHLGKL